MDIKFLVACDAVAQILMFQPLLKHSQKKNIDGTSVIGDWFGDQTIHTSKDLRDGIDKFNEHVRSLLLSKDGFKIYKTNCPKKSDKHTKDTFNKLLNVVIKKAGQGTPCYLGFIDIDRVARCMFSHGKLY